MTDEERDNMLISIHTAIKGDEYGNKGILKTINEHAEYIQHEKINKAKQKGLIAGIGIASGGLGAWLKSLFIG